jgi:hypothetical protein
MSSLEIVAQAVDVIVDDVVAWGRRACESGAFLLSTSDEPDHMSIVAVAGATGIERGRDRFRVSGTAVEQLFGWAGDAKLRIRAQVHSHRGVAFLSRTDLQYGFSVEGFMTSVVPCYASPSAEPSTWRWWEFSGYRWHERPGPAIVSGSAMAFSFDARGVHER